MRAIYLAITNLMQSIFTPTAPISPASAWVILTRNFSRARSTFASVPPPSLVLLSSFVIQISNVLAKSLFDSLGSIGTAFLCKLLAAVLLVAIARPQWRGHSRRDYVLLGVMGLSMAGMGLSYMGAIERVPLGVASTLEFVGPLGVSVLGSRRSLDLVWVGLAAAGIVLLHPSGYTALDPLGILLALSSGLCWAVYILSSGAIARVLPGGSGLTIAMLIAALLLAVPGVTFAGTALLNPIVLLVGLGAACFGTVLPYSLEFEAVRRMPPRVFGVLVSIEPAIAALVGFLFLHETLTLQTLMATMLVTTAAIGVTLFGRSPNSHS